MPELENLLEAQIDRTDVAPDFRIWLTTMPS